MLINGSQRKFVYLCRDPDSGKRTLIRFFLKVVFLQRTFLSLRVAIRSIPLLDGCRTCGSRGL